MIRLRTHICQRSEYEGWEFKIKKKYSKEGLYFVTIFKVTQIEEKIQTFKSI